MKQTTTEVITKLTIEYDELARRIGSLERFLISKDGQGVSIKQRALLNQQRDAMQEYKEILLIRLVDLRAQELDEANRTHEPEKANKDERIEPHVFSAMEYEAHRQKTSPEAKDGTSAD